MRHLFTMNQQKKMLQQLTTDGYLKYAFWGEIIDKFFLLHAFTHITMMARAAEKKVYFYCNKSSRVVSEYVRDGKGEK